MHILPSIQRRSDLWYYFILYISCTGRRDEKTPNSTLKHQITWPIVFNVISHAKMMKEVEISSIWCHGKIILRYMHDPVLNLSFLRQRYLRQFQMSTGNVPIVHASARKILVKRHFFSFLFFLQTRHRRWLFCSDNFPIFLYIAVIIRYRCDSVVGVSPTRSIEFPLQYSEIWPNGKVTLKCWMCFYV